MDNEPQEQDQYLSQVGDVFAELIDTPIDCTETDPGDIAIWDDMEPHTCGSTDSVLLQWGEVSVLATDLGADGHPDLAEIDTTGDGVADVTATRQWDGSYLLQLDTAGDGVVDTELTLTSSELAAAAPQLADLLDHTIALDLGPDSPGVPMEENPATEDPDVIVDGQLVGDPQGDAKFWFEQAANGFCLPASVAQIVSEYTGIDYQDESAFVELANEGGLFTVDGQGVPGIAFEDGVTLLQEAGVPATLQYGDMDTVSTYLAQGRGIVLFIDSGEVWNGETTEDDAPDHAVIITGIDRATGLVYLSDPGSPTGNMEPVPIDTLRDAWQDSDFQMIVCDEPADPTEEVTAEEVTAAGPWSALMDKALHSPTGWTMLPVVLKSLS